MYDLAKLPTLVRIHRKVDGRQLEMGPQGNPISGEATRFLALLTKYRGHRMRVARAENVTRQAISRRLMGFYGLYPDVFGSFVRRREPLVSNQNARTG